MTVIYGSLTAFIRSCARFSCRYDWRQMHAASSSKLNSTLTSTSYALNYVHPPPSADIGSIPQVARRAAYQSTGENDEAIRRHIQEHPDVDGVVTGDETRLRQIITNLARWVTFPFINEVSEINGFSCYTAMRVNSRLLVVNCLSQHASSCQLWIPCAYLLKRKPRKSWQAMRSGHCLQIICRSIICKMRVRHR